MTNIDLENCKVVVENRDVNKNNSVTYKVKLVDQETGEVYSVEENLTISQRQEQKDELFENVLDGWANKKAVELNNQNVDRTGEEHSV